MKNKVVLMNYHYFKLRFRYFDSRYCLSDMQPLLSVLQAAFQGTKLNVLYYFILFNFANILIETLLLRGPSENLTVISVFTTLDTRNAGISWEVLRVNSKTFCALHSLI